MIKVLVFIDTET